MPKTALQFVKAAIIIYLYIRAALTLIQLFFRAVDATYRLITRQK